MTLLEIAKQAEANAYTKALQSNLPEDWQVYQDLADKVDAMQSGELIVVAL